MNFIKESKVFIYSITGIFFLFVMIGFFVPPPEAISDQILKFIEELLKKTQDLSQFELIKFIFFNNIQSSFFGMILGVLLGLFPVIFAISNGYVLGFVASVSVDIGGIFILLRLFPHGIFELPAIFISLGLGLKIMTFIFEKNKLKTLKIYIKNSLRTFLFIVIPLLIIAAVIEGSLIFFN
jgi:stage II sporulation protein M